MSKKLLSSILLVFFGGLILSLPSAFNNFPFVYYDTGYYLNHGTIGVSYWSYLWRPVTYALFLSSILKFANFYIFILTQNLIISTALYCFFKKILNEVSINEYLGSIVLMFLTPLPYYSNFILPDVFTGILLLLICLSFLNLRKIGRVIHFFGLITFSIFHHSNILVTSIVTFILLFFRSVSLKVRLILLSLVFLPALTLATLHYAVTENFTISNMSHALVFSRLMAVGIGTEYLDKNCGKGKKLLLCKHRDKPFHIWDWSEESQIGQLGGLHNLAYDFRTINKDVFTSEYGLRFAMRSFGNIAQQFFYFATPLPVTLYSNELQEDLVWKSKTYVEKWKNQKLQNAPEINFQILLKWIYILSTLISLTILAVSYSKKTLDRRIHFFVTISILFYTVNAIVCGGLTDPLPRYSGRIIWVFGLLAIVHVIAVMREKKRISEL